MFCDSLTNCAYIIGIAYLGKRTWDLFFILYVHILRYFYFEKIDLKQRYGKWAVVTGGSDGLGECYCKEFASRGINIVLISEKLHRLKEVSVQLESKFGVETKYIHADLRGGRDVYDNITKELENLDIGILVNNAGVANVTSLHVEDMTHDQIMTQILVNISATTRMCKVVLPSMKVKNRGVIVNISSMSHVVGLPYHSVYAGSKAYVRTFIESLQFECRNSNVDIQVITPTFLRTDMTAAHDIVHKYMATSVQNFAKQAVNTIGVVNKTAGSLGHDLQLFFLQNTPDKIARTMLGLMVEQERKRS